MSKTTKEELACANDFLSFVNACPTQFHAVGECASRLETQGFVKISEKSDTDFANIKPGGKYYFTRNQSTIFALAVGKKWAPGNGFNIMGAHTDSPVLKIKPVSKISKVGYMQVGVETYGGGLWNTWFDRDLSVAGRVIVDKGDGRFESRLVDLKKPILRIPNLAIHLNRTIYEKGFNPNKETHCVPVLATAVKDALSKEAIQEGGEPAAKKIKIDETEEPGHHPVLLSLLAEELSVSVAQIRDFELCLYDTQPAALGGVYSEFINSRALDNLMMSFTTLSSLMESCQSGGLDNEKQMRIVALFDNEEIGSNSCMGAASNMMFQVLQRLNKEQSTYDSAVRKSFLISADMAHAVHPNYADKHEERHRPAMHGGLVVKQNANQRYATTAITHFLLSEIAKRHSIKLQKFVVRQDTGCGSTIGPILASNCGIRTIDVGIAQLAMHSIREMCGTSDVLSTKKLFTAVFHEFAELDGNLENAD